MKAIDASSYSLRAKFLEPSIPTLMSLVFIFFEIFDEKGLVVHILNYILIPLHFLLGSELMGWSLMEMHIIGL